MDAEILLLLLAGVLVLAGLAGLIFPALPGAPVLFAGLALAAWAEDFQYVSVWTVAVLGVLAIIIWLADFAAGAMGARKFGASRRAVSGAAIGALIGIFFGLPGIILGPFVGAVIGELTVLPDLRAASRAGLGATLGLALGVAVKMAIAFTMLGIFILARFT